MGQKRILLIEDDEVMEKTISEALFEEGYSVMTEKNGEDGLKTAIKHHPDLILLDIEMPKMNGLELLDQLRTDDWGKTAKVIIITAHSESDKVAHALEKEAYDYVLKSENGLSNIVEKIKIKLK